MKTNLASRPLLSRTGGFTLVEFMVVMLTMVIVVGAAMSAYIYGLRGDAGAV